MPFAALDDQFHSNPKIIAAGLDGAGLYARALSYCADYLTDGFVPGPWARSVAGRQRRAIDRLVNAGLWVTADGGFRVPDYLDYNPSKADIVKRREERAKAGRKGARKRWSGSKGHGKSHSKSDGEQHGEQIARGRARAGAAPSPELLSEGEGEKGSGEAAPPQQAAEPPEYETVSNGRRIDEEGLALDRDARFGDAARDQKYKPHRGDAYVRNALVHVPANEREHDLRYQFPDITAAEVHRLLDLAADLDREPEPA